MGRLGVRLGRRFGLESIRRPRSTDVQAEASSPSTSIPPGPSPSGSGKLDVSPAVTLEAGGETWKLTPHCLHLIRTPTRAGAILPRSPQDGHVTYGIVSTSLARGIRRAGPWATSLAQSRGNRQNPEREISHRKARRLFASRNDCHLHTNALAQFDSNRFVTTRVNSMRYDRDRPQQCERCIEIITPPGGITPSNMQPNSLTFREVDW